MVPVKWTEKLRLKFFRNSLLPALDQLSCERKQKVESNKRTRIVIDLELGGILDPVDVNIPMSTQTFAPLYRAWNKIRTAQRNTVTKVVLRVIVGDRYSYIC